MIDAPAIGWMDPTWPAADPQLTSLSVAWPIAALVVVLAYLAGSIPFGLLVGLARGVDVRTHGSGNIGATNVGRLLGRGYGFLVFALDFLKGLGPVLLVSRLGQSHTAAPWLATGRGWEALAAQLKEPSAAAMDFVRYDLPVVCALAALLGHTFPVWLRFRGGKGGATGLGVGLVLAPHAVLAGLASWILVVVVTRYVSLGTMLAALVFALSYFGTVDDPLAREHVALSAFVLIAVLLVIMRHRSNIVRLARGTENKIGAARPQGTPPTGAAG